MLRPSQRLCSSKKPLSVAKQNSTEINKKVSYQLNAFHSSQYLKSSLPNCYTALFMQCGNAGHLRKASRGLSAPHFLLRQYYNKCIAFRCAKGFVRLTELYPVMKRNLTKCKCFKSSYCFYRAMHFSAKRGIAIACRLSVRLSVCLSVCL